MISDLHPGSTSYASYIFRTSCYAILMWIWLYVYIGFKISSMDVFPGCKSYVAWHFGVKACHKDRYKNLYSINNAKGESVKNVKHLTKLLWNNGRNNRQLNISTITSNKILSSDEPIFCLNGSVNRHNCKFWLSTIYIGLWKFILNIHKKLVIEPNWS